MLAQLHIMHLHHHPLQARFGGHQAEVFSKPQVQLCESRCPNQAICPDLCLQEDVKTECTDARQAEWGYETCPSLTLSS